jgi:2-(1,2-epoxy-1,2-dihydrophenyl)acetyl-CoA isomerase
MSHTTISLDEADGIATLTLNRPTALNALTPDMVCELNMALDDLRDKGTARVLLMTGAGRAFCSGADLSGVEPAGPPGRPIDAGSMLEVSHNPLIERLFALPIPVVTAINGLAAGGGCSVAIAGDIVFAARSSYLLLAFVNIGLVPDMGATWLLPRLAGRARASAMMLLGERISAAQALEWGLVYKVVDDAELMGVARATAAKLARGPTRSYQLIRQGLRQSLEKPLSDTLWLERVNQRKAGATEDFIEGVKAFLGKRAAVFKGR